MTKNILAIILVGFLSVACKKEKNLQINGGNLTEKDLEICKGIKCPEITINYLEAEGDKEVADKINKKINDFIISTLSLEEGSKSQFKSIKEAAQSFVDSYRADKSRFPDMAADYFAEVSVTEIYNSPKHICLEMRQYLFTGGAHGYGTTSFINIDPDTGEELSEAEIFSDKKEFTSFAEKKFRKIKKIGDDQSINDPGFWFEDDVFYLPETVGFTQDSIIFVYNQYDIASYADGPIELKIGLDEAQPYLKLY